MILQISGIFILAFAAGYLAGGFWTKLRKKKAASSKDKKAVKIVHPSQSKAEKLN